MQTRHTTSHLALHLQQLMTQYRIPLLQLLTFLPQLRQLMQVSPHRSTYLMRQHMYITLDLSPALLAQIGMCQTCP